MSSETIRYLHDLHFITREQRETIERLYSKEVFSLQSELRSVLAAGILLVITGVALFALDRLDTIGHQVLIFSLFLIMSGCLVYTMATAAKYSHQKIEGQSFTFDVVLMVACILFMTILVYVQLRYSFSGSEWQLVALIPGIVFIPLAYRYDHRGVLVLGILNIAIATGLSAAPVNLVRRGYVTPADLISVSLAFGALLSVLGLATQSSSFKKHFGPAYMHVGVHFLFGACLAGMVFEERLLFFFILLAILLGCGTYYAKRMRSFAFFIVSSIYTYVGISYIVSKAITDETIQTLYVVVSFAAVAIGLIAARKSFVES